MPKPKTENTKKAAGNAKKAEVAAQKQAAEEQKKAAVEDTKWKQGTKDTSKSEAAEAKQAEAARKKAEKEALLKEEEASLPSKPTSKSKVAPKKSRGLDLSGLDAPSSKKELAALSATGIDNALDALSLTAADNEKVDRHPERRFKAAYAAFEERRLDEMKDDKSLRRQQKVDQIRKEFDKSSENPFNQVNASYNARKDELSDIRETERSKKEDLLTTD